MKRVVKENRLICMKEMRGVFLLIEESFTGVKCTKRYESIWESEESCKSKGQVRRDEEVKREWCNE